MSHPSDPTEPATPSSGGTAPDAADAPVSITVRYFAVLRERRGCDHEQVQVAAGTSVRELYRALCPPLPQGELPVMFAVNRDYVGPAHRVLDGDEVAFIPPLGGG